MITPIQRIEIDRKELEAYLQLARGVLGEDRYNKLMAALETLDYLTELVEDKDMTINRLRQIVFGASTEKTRNVLDTPIAGTTSNDTKAADNGQNDRPSGNEGERNEHKKHKGHGRNGAQSYTGAKEVHVAHESLKPGDPCPDCTKGKVYGKKKPACIVRLVGQAPIGATVYKLEQLRCNLCGRVFTARAPGGIGGQKYDERAAGMIALLKYGSGFPFHRLGRLQGSMGIPLPDSTQWEIVREVARVLEPACQELIRQAAQGEVLHNDDTTMKVLELMKRQRKPEAPAEPAADPKTRTGIFTSGIVSTREGREIALFFTGHKHAGENLKDVLAQRARELGPPIQMCDALSRNLPKDLQVIVSHCTAHARRNFIDVAPKFPEECRYVLETLSVVYKNDALAKEQKLSPEGRLCFHQTESGPLMEEFERWLNEQIDQKKVEPNSGLGEAICYMIKHWNRLTLFLRVAGAPLDNNICERALKQAILHRKGSLFYKTTNGAHVGDLFMSLIHTCRLCAADPFDYLTELQKHADDLARSPQDWMPWNYRDALQGSFNARAAPA